MPTTWRVLVAGTTRQEIESLMDFSQRIASSPEDSIVALGLVHVPSDQSLSTGVLDARRLREAVEPTVQRLDGKVIVRVAHNLWREIEEIISDQKCTLLLLDWNSAPPQDWLRTLPCDLAIVKPNSSFVRIRRILLPIRGGPYAALALRIALAIAELEHAEITVLHAVPHTRRDDQYQELLARLRALPQVTNWINVRGDAVNAIVKASRTHQLVIMGGIAKPRLDGPPIGPTATSILKKTKISTLVVRSAQPSSLATTSERLSEPVDYTISVIVDKWFAENTFDACEFKDLKHLVKLKEQQGLTISLGLPALNEEKTIGKIIQTMQREFVGRHPLLDEIVVIDSNSTDHTVEIAESLGVRVVKHPEVLTQYEVWSGKGEALWNSLYVLRGDLVAWIDTDIVNIHPRFVYGILGPLIREPHLMYVKGFYQRPLRIGRKLEARGGGRVTELVARPLLNMFYPELSGFVQPLAGEYAGRRQALERVPFFAGYGVEIGLLIDIWKRYGLHAMGQVDLEERIHRNQSLSALSKMAFEIIQVVMLRVGATRGDELVNELNKSMKLIRYEQNEFQLDVADIRARARPAMITIPEYRNLRGYPSNYGDFG